MEKAYPDFRQYKLGHVAWVLWMLALAEIIFTEASERIMPKNILRIFIFYQEIELVNVLFVYDIVNDSQDGSSLDLFPQFSIA